MPKIRESSNKSAASLSPLRIIGVLPPVAGGQENLLPKDAWLLPLRVEFDLWDNPTPADDAIDVIQLIWDGDEVNPVDEKSFTGPITEEDLANLWLEVPVSALSEDVHSMYYRRVPWNDVDSEYVSVPVDVTIDKTAPILPSLDASKLVFPSAVLPPNAITATYLTANGNSVKARLPTYTTAAPGDVVTAFWKNLDNATTHEIRSQPLTSSNYQNPVDLTFTTDFLRDTVGDGQWQVTYQVEDRAGNPSEESAPVNLIVSVLRSATRAWVIETEDNSSSWAELKAQKALTGATVRIPDTAVYYPDDRVEVQFGVPDAVGSFSGFFAPGSKDIRVPKENIAACFNKELPVYYIIHLPDGSTLKSTDLTLKVNPLPDVYFFQSQLVSPHSDPVYKSLIPSQGLPLFQRTWPFISKSCLITMTVSGTADNPVNSDVILDEHPVSDTQVTDGVYVNASRDFMLTLRDNTRFTITTQVSFDGGGSWFTFPTLTPMLQP